MIDRTLRRDKRDRKRGKRWLVHGRSLQSIVNAVRNRAKKVVKHAGV